MKKLKKTILILVLLSLVAGYGQVNIKKSNVSTGGGSATVGNTTLTYAIGEVSVREDTQGNTHLSEGFIGPDILTAVGIENYGELTGIEVYPNPVDTYLNLELPDTARYEIYLYELTGQQLLSVDTADDTRLQLNLSLYPPAVYMLMVVDRNNKKSKIIKIQKN